MHFRHWGIFLRLSKLRLDISFPATTGKQLFELTKSFKELTERMEPSIETVVQLRRTFKGIFAVLDIGWEIIKGVVGVFKDLVGATSAGSGGFLLFTAKIGSALVKFHEWLIEGGRLAKFFDSLGFAFSLPLKAIQALADALKSVFGGVDTGGFTEKLSPVEKILKVISTLFNKLVDQMGDFGKILQPLFDAWVNLVETFGVALIKAFSNMNFEAVLAVVRTGLFAGIVLMFKKFLGKGSLLDQIGKGFAGGIIGNISSSFGALSGSMKALQGSLVAMQQTSRQKLSKKSLLRLLSWRRQWLRCHSSILRNLTRLLEQLPSHLVSCLELCLYWAIFLSRWALSRCQLLQQL